MLPTRAAHAPYEVGAIGHVRGGGSEESASLVSQGYVKQKGPSSRDLRDRGEPGTNESEGILCDLEIPHLHNSPERMKEIWFDMVLKALLKRHIDFRTWVMEAQLVRSGRVEHCCKPDCL